MTMTREDRMKAWFRASKDRINKGDYGEHRTAQAAVSAMYLSMARLWKMPVQEIKAILGTPTRESILAGEHAPPWSSDDESWDW